MDAIRKLHNGFKRALIEEHVREGDHVLDVGSGFGGDLQKYRARGCRFGMCDPCPEALEEAKSRAKKMRIPVDAWYVGDITSTPKRRYDVVAYLFSFHYIFASRDLFFKSIRAIRDRVKKGGKLIGIIPDSEMINWKTPLKDELGNWFQDDTCTPTADSVRSSSLNWSIRRSTPTGRAPSRSATKMFSSLNWRVSG